MPVALLDAGATVAGAAARRSGRCAKARGRHVINRITVEQTGSPIRRYQRETLIGLGLNRIGAYRSGAAR
jgi:hypothetical protein